MTAVPSEPLPLCVTCGICCTDALFHFSNVTAEESPQLRSLGFPIEVEDGKERFTHPCVQLRGAVCQVYEQRPATCRAFRCPTLQALEGLTIDRAEADRRVSISKAAIQNLRQYLSPDERIWEFRKRIYADPLAPREALLAQISFDLVADRYLRPPSRRNLDQQAMSRPGP